MSIITEGIAPCGGCGGRHTVKIYKSINTADNPELKTLVKDGSLFLWQCPHCGKTNLARYETLYHDPEGKLMVWLIPEGEVSETQMQAITMHTKAMGGYTLRRVNDMGSLMEKVLIHEAGLDDMVLEMCKYVTKMEIASKTDAEAMSRHFHFYRKDDDAQTITFMYHNGRDMVGANIGYNVYEDCCGIIERNPSVRSATDGFARIDSDWLLSIMK